MAWVQPLLDLKTWAGPCPVNFKFDHAKTPVFNVFHTLWAEFHHLGYFLKAQANVFFLENVTQKVEILGYYLHKQFLYIFA